MTSSARASSSSADAPPANGVRAPSAPAKTPAIAVTNHSKHCRHRQIMHPARRVAAVGNARPRNHPHWTEVPSFLSLWRDHVGRWPWINRLDNRTINPEQQAAAADSMRGLFQAEPSISDNVRAIGAHDRRSWLEGFDFRMKSEGRIMEKVSEALETSSPDATVREIAQQIPDAIRYTFCLRPDDYTAGCRDIKERLESCGYEMYYSKNSWADPEYKGINTRWVTPEGQRFRGAISHSGKLSCEASGYARSLRAVA